MPHPLQEHIASIRHRARTLLLAHGVTRLLAIVVGLVLVAGLIDFGLRLSDRGLRIMLSLAVLVAVVWATWRFLVQAVLTRFSDTEIAFRIQHRFPQLGDRLASAIEFLHQAPDEAHAGSVELRRAVIAKATAEVEDLDLASSLERRPLWRSIAATVLVCALAIMFVVMDPVSSRLAVSRLFLPWANARWPQVNHLTFRQRVDQVAFGDPVEFEVVDVRGAELPEQVSLEFRYEGETPTDLPLTADMQFVGDMMVYRRDAVTRPFAYRAVGGDDDSMAWIQLHVVEAPEIEDPQFHLSFPEYTGWEPATVDAPIQALRGTQVRIAASLSKAIKNATLHLESGGQFPCKLDENGRSLVTPTGSQESFDVTSSDTLWFDLVDEQGFNGGKDTRYQLQVIEDAAPSVTVEKPDTNLFVTSAAEIPLTLVARDDLALHQVELRYLRSDRSDEGEQIVSLYEGPAKVEPGPAPLDAAAAESDRRRIDYRWDVAALELPPGTQLTFYAAALDYLPQSGQSLPRRVTIITPEELQQRITERQRYIMGQLSRALKQQQTARSRVTELEIQMQQVGKLGKPDVDQLQAAELTQRQVRRTLTDENDGITSQIDSLLVELENNNLETPELRQRLEDLQQAISQVATDPLASAEQALVDSLKQSQTILETTEDTEDRQPAAEDAEVAKSLMAAGQSQDNVVQSLESLLSELGQWNNYRQFAEEIAQVRREQHELAEQTAELGRRTLTRGVEDLAPQELADLNKIAERQQELARRFERVMQGMRQMRDELEADDPLTADTLSDALEQSRELSVGGQMGNAGRQVRENQVGQAVATQRQVDQDLQELMDVLSNRRENELSRLVKKLREAERELEQLREEHEGLRKKTEAAAQEPDPEERERQLKRLARQERELQEKTERFARKLQRLQAERASRTAQQAGQSMAAASQQGEQGQAGEASDSSNKAQKDLDDAQQQLAQRRQQAEMDLAFEQLTRMAETLAGLRDQQSGVLEETTRLSELETTQGHLTRAQQISLNNLARRQQAIAQETEDATSQLTAAKIFQLALTRARESMLEASDLLGEQKTGPATQRAEQNALRRFEQLLSALEQDEPEQGDGEQQGNDGGQGGGQSQPPTDGIPPLAQLKVLKMMQQDLNSRTDEIRADYQQQGEWTPELQARLAEISEEQGLLAELARGFSQPSEPAPEDDPENLPDLFDEEALPALDLDLQPTPARLPR